MVCLELCPSIEFSTVLEFSVLSRYQTALLGAGLVFWNSMACRVFRLLRRLKAEEELIIASMEMSAIQFYRIPQGREVSQEVV